MKTHRLWDIFCTVIDNHGDLGVCLRLTRQQVERGHGFAAGVTERAGHDGLSQLFNKAGNLPTPNELDAPGLWLARIELQNK